LCVTGVQTCALPISTSMLTIVGVAILLLPVLFRTWRDFSRTAH
jgi:hypothetical protein